MPMDPPPTTPTTPSMPMDPTTTPWRAPSLSSTWPSSTGPRASSKQARPARPLKSTHNCPQCRCSPPAPSSSRRSRPIWRERSGRRRKLWSSGILRNRALPSTPTCSAWPPNSPSTAAPPVWTDWASTSTASSSKSCRATRAWPTPPRAPCTSPPFRTTSPPTRCSWSPSKPNRSTGRPGWTSPSYVSRTPRCRWRWRRGSDRSPPPGSTTSFSCTFSSNSSTTRMPSPSYNISCRSFPNPIICRHRWPSPITTCAILIRPRNTSSPCDREIHTDSNRWTSSPTYSTSKTAKRNSVTWPTRPSKTINTDPNPAASSETTTPSKENTKKPSSTSDAPSSSTETTSPPGPSSDTSTSR
mmetsp:Transcript_31938/g.73462  ORF Transcript_31938/g.73462 Transcript_31938/m.73462 type:complete len:356 (+) Transcript_31938:983-2050(+)